MIMRPCTKCSFKNDCEWREDIRKAVKGLGLTSVMFTCNKRTEHLPPGTRVSAIFKAEAGMTSGNAYNAEPPEPYFEDMEFHGTVMLHQRQKVMVWLDEFLSGGHPHTIARVWPDRLTVLDEPLISVCSLCGKPDGKENSKNWCCEECDGVTICAT